MATDIDSLQIQINATAAKANTALDALVRKLDRLTNALSAVDGSRLNSLANGVQRLGTAMQTMNNVKTADFTRLAKNLTTLNKLDVSKLGNVSANITQIGNAVSGISNVSQGVAQITELANGIKQLGYSSAEKAIKNIPDLAKAMKDLMAELSTAPKVSKNLIDMTNALAKLARTGASSGKAATSLSSVFDRIGVSSGNAVKGIKKINLSISGLTRKILPFISLYKLFDWGKQAVEVASSLTEIQNVVDVTFGDYRQKIEDLASVSIPELGMSELTTKQIASRFQAMGTAMGFTKGKMADMSVELTRLTGDMASFYDVTQEDVGKALQSIFTGETEPMRKYGIDLTNATIKQWALNNGLNANISSMSQAEKAMLRYQYVMANTGAAQGDFLRTQDTWSNQVRILKQQLQQLASVIGGSLINAFKPLVKALNVAISGFITFAKVVSDSLGKIFGWKYEESGTGGVTSELEGAADAADDIADGIGNATGNAQKLKKTLSLLPFDELNQLADNTNTENGGSGGSGGSDAGSIGGTAASTGEWVKTESILKEYESELDNLYKLGEYIGNALTKVLKDIKWSEIYKVAENFGKGLADFLNGLISPELFGEIGKTIASSLNTALTALNSFGTRFDWRDFGKSISSGINKFFRTFDFKLAADTVNSIGGGILNSIISGLNNTEWYKIGNQISQFIRGIKWQNLLSGVGHTIWSAINAGIELWKGIFGLDTIEGKLNGLENELKLSKLADGLKQLGESLSPFVKGFAQGFIDVIDFLVNDVGANVIEAIGDGFTIIGNALSIVPPQTLEAIGAAFGGIGAGIATIIISETLLTSLNTLLTLFGFGKGVIGSTSGGLIGGLFSLDPKGAAILAAVGGITALLKELDKLIDWEKVWGDLGTAVNDFAEKTASALGITRTETRDSSQTFDILREALVNTGIAGDDTGEKMAEVMKSMEENVDGTVPNLEQALANVTEAFVNSGGSAEDLKNSIRVAMVDSYGITEENANLIMSYINSTADTFENASTKSDAMNTSINEGKEYSLWTELKMAALALTTKLFGDNSETASDNMSDLNSNISSIKTTQPKNKIKNLSDELTTLSENSEKAAENWTNGLILGFENSVEKLDEPIFGITDSIIKGTQTNLGEHSPSTISYGFGENWVLGFMNGFSEKSVVLLENMKQFWQKIKDVFANVTADFTTIGTSAVSGLEIGLYDNEDAIIAAIKLRNKVESVFNDISLKKYGKQAAVTFASGISSVHIPMPHITVNSSAYASESGYSYKMNSSVRWYQNGGFPSGEIWGMNENGNPEMVGRVGNKTAVANNEIIADAIEGAVIKGMAQVFANSGVGGSPQYIMNSINIDGKEVAKAVTKAQENRDSRFNPSPAY